MLKPFLQGSAAGVAIFFVCTGVVAVLGWFVPRDATDAPQRRSGMTLYTDHETGCQYLGASGGLTPRMTAAGAHYCTQKATP